MLFPAKAKMALAGVVVAGGAAAAAALGPAGPAVGQSSPPIQVQLQVSSTASLVAKGAGVDVSVTASCSGQLVESGSVAVGVTERAGSEIATGSGSATVDCTGTAQTVDVIVAPTPPLAGPGEAVGAAFKKGTAVADASIQACTVNFFTCNSQGVEQTIDIGK